MAATHFTGPVYSTNGFISGPASGPAAGAYDLIGAQTGITSGTTQTQAGATAVLGPIVNVSTNANAGDGIRLPPALKGRVIYVANPTANAVQVYGAGTDTINAVATATGVSQATLKHACYFCAVDGNWNRILSA